MLQTPAEYLSRHEQLSAAAIRTGRWYAHFTLALAAMYALMLVGLGLIPLTQPLPVVIGVGVFLAGLGAITVWQVRHQRTWPRFLTPVHVGVVLTLSVVNGVAVIGGTGVLMPTTDPAAWFVAGALAALLVGLIAWLLVLRGTGSRGVDRD